MYVWIVKKHIDMSFNSPYIYIDTFAIIRLVYKKTLCIYTSRLKNYVYIYIYVCVCRVKYVKLKFSLYIYI